MCVVDEIFDRTGFLSCVQRPFKHRQPDPLQYTCLHACVHTSTATLGGLISSWPVASIQVTSSQLPAIYMYIYIYIRMFCAQQVVNAYICMHIYTGYGLTSIHMPTTHPHTCVCVYVCTRAFVCYIDRRALKLSCKLVYVCSLVQV